MFEVSAQNSQMVLDQISNLVNRYNEIAADVQNLENLQAKKEIEVKRVKAEFNADIEELKRQLAELKELVSKATRYKMNVGSDFKQIIKKDSFNKLSKRIDALNYENNISRDELYKLIERET
jgi:hypothetical protein